ncbi:MAG TPA: hypothetical protein VN802_01395 [Stellaceae bacterium]|nr:hypothetical protein [Stellaceae bacterium]
MRRRPPERSHADSVRRFADAVQASLGPLGCRQKGRLPLWVADQRFWAVLVEFEPGGERGEAPHLKAGACWLWYAQSYWSFDYGNRIAGTADDPAAFARRAAEEVAALRAKFPSVAAVARHLVAASGDAHWPLYHAAVASGIAGDRDTAARLFQRLDEKPATRDWQATLRTESRVLARSLEEHGAFRRSVGDVIGRMRALQGLPPDPACFDDSRAFH